MALGAVSATGGERNCPPARLEGVHMPVAAVTTIRPTARLSGTTMLQNDSLSVMGVSHEAELGTQAASPGTTAQTCPRPAGIHHVGDRLIRTL